MKLAKMHHLAIICRDEQKAKDFYINKLGFELLDEHHRPEKKDVLINIKKGEMVLELFIKPNAPKRVSGLPLGEAYGLRHLAFKVADVEKTVDQLEELGIKCEPIRQDDFDGKKMTFFRDPDGLPLEIHE